MVNWVGEVFSFLMWIFLNLPEAALPRTFRRTLFRQQGLETGIVAQVVEFRGGAQLRGRVAAVRRSLERGERRRAIAKLVIDDASLELYLGVGGLQLQGAAEFRQ